MDSNAARMFMIDRTIHRWDMTNETILVGGFSHETNVFAPTKTTRGDFQDCREYFGDNIIQKMRGTNTSVGGALDIIENSDAELIPIVEASATPGGVVSRDTFDFYKDSIVEAVRDHRNELDGVFLPLHGAMVAEGMVDGEGPLVAAIREEIGSNTPIVVTLDLHGNITDELVANANALIAYETYPHVDTGDTGRRGMRFLLQTIRGEIDPVMQIHRPPLSPVTPLQSTREEPMAKVMARARELETREILLRLTYSLDSAGATSRQWGSQSPW